MKIAILIVKAVECVQWTLIVVCCVTRRARDFRSWENHEQQDENDDQTRKAHRSRTHVAPRVYLCVLGVYLRPTCLR